MRDVASAPHDVGLVVHGHREGHAAGGNVAISDECLARLRVAEAAVARYGVRDVLLCGAGAPGHPSEASQMAQAWRGQRVRLWLDETSTDSAENAVQALRWTQLARKRELLVVSSWWHLRLALYYRPFRAQGVVVHHLKARRTTGAWAHIAHELRHLPRALGWRIEAR